MKDRAQLSIFDVIAPKPEPIPQITTTSTFDFDSTMAQLEKLRKMGDEMNSLLKSMLDDIQKDWTEEEKMQVNNPKEYYRLQKLKKQDNPEPEIMAKELTSEAIEVLKNCTVESNVVKLPDVQLDRKVYVEVKDRLELIGGKWKGGKVGGFVFQEDPTELLEEIANGGNRNLKKEFQFFATPDALADKLVELADINDGNVVLEPSAGQGAIIKAIYKAFPRNMVGPNDDPCVTVDYLELMPVNKKVLSTKFNEGRTSDMGDDFLLFKPDRLYDRIVANPPFTKNSDVNHIYHMYKHLKPGGRLVSLSSNHWRHSTGSKEKGFSEWLVNMDAKVIDVDSGTFKESGTNIATCIIIIDKK